MSASEQVWLRIRAVSRRYGIETALDEKRHRVGTKAFARLVSTYEHIERERLTFQYHTGGFREDFLAGVNPATGLMQ